MAYSRPPVQPGRALTRTPAVPVETTAGVFDFALDADIATATNLGVVQIGSGLSITPTGILSATGGSGSFINVKLTNVDYTATVDDYYIGATEKDIDITLPLGETGKVYVIKNQISGNIKVKGSGGQKIDTASDVALGTNDSLTVVFDGTRWNVIE
jgi:hypothetical protein